MSEPHRDHHPALDTTDFSTEQVARVLEWQDHAERLARINELHLAWLAMKNHHLRYAPEVQLHILGRMATLAFGDGPDWGGDEPA